MSEILVSHLNLQKSKLELAGLFCLIFFRKKLIDKLPSVRSHAESNEIVEKLKMLENQLAALKPSRDTQPRHGAGLQHTGSCQ